MRSGRTCSPRLSSTAVCAAPPARRKHSRSTSHSACQPPADRSSSLINDCVRTTLRDGTCSAADRIIVANTGLRLCGIAEDTPRPGGAGSATSAISVRLNVSTSTANFPSAPVTNAVVLPISAIGVRSACHGRPDAASPVLSANAAFSFSTNTAGSAPCCPAYSRYPARVPAAPPRDTGSASASATTRARASRIS
ncbi:Uncharacterised protein [Mycobacteroides abscessus]|nr:Uncharacterised protein [Mycobacteroides abscessus]